MFLLTVGILLLAATATQADTTLRGKLTDAHTGIPLEAATIQVLNTYDATISNPEGRFVLSIRSLPTTIRVTHIGYQHREIVLTTPPTDTLYVHLDPVVFVLDELVVTADMGANIMQKVIQQKQIWRKRLESFEVDAYSRFVFKNHTGIVSIVESASEGLWHRDHGWREVIIGRRQTSNLDVDFDEAIPAASAVTNLYDDNVEVAGHNLIGVTHPDALDKYDFQVTGRRYLDSRVIYDIAVKPRNRLVSGFEGQVSVLDSAFALVAAKLKPGPSFVFPPPIKSVSVSYEQQFRDFGKGVWLPVDFHFNAELNIGFIGLQFPPIKAEQVSRLSNYRVNTTVPDTLLKEKRTVKVDHAAVKSDTVLAKPGVAVPLSETEQNAYAQIDSSMTLEKAYKPTGFFARFIEEDEKKKNKKDNEKKKEEGKQAAQKNKKDEKKKTGRNLSLDTTPELWFNRVDGTHLGLKTVINSQDLFTLGGTGAYNTSMKRWSFSSTLTSRWGKGRRSQITVRAFRETDTRHQSHLYNRTVASSLQLLGAHDYFDYFWNKGIQTRLRYRFPKSNVMLTAGANIEQHSSLNKTTDWALISRTDIQRPNPAINPGDLRSGVLQIKWEGDNDGPAFLMGQRKIWLQVEHSRTAWQSDFSFTQFKGVIDWRLNTFFRRRLLPNVLDIRLIASTHTGTLPRQRYDILDTSLEALSLFGAFRSRLDHPYEGEKVLGLFWEHNFRTVPFEILGWRWPIERHITLILHGAHGRTYFSTSTLSSLPYTPHYQNRFHHELGFSINGLFNILRIDFTRRLDESAYYITFGVARLF